MVINSFSFGLSGKLFTSAGRTALLSTVFLVGSVFFEHFDYIIPLLGCMVSAEESYSFVELHPYVRTFFFLEAFKIFAL